MSRSMSVFLAPTSPNPRSVRQRPSTGAEVTVSLSQLRNPATHWEVSKAALPQVISCITPLRSSLEGVGQSTCHKTQRR